jgi:hypothetical protein
VITREPPAGGAVKRAPCGAGPGRRAAGIVAVGAMGSYGWYGLMERATGGWGANGAPGRCGWANGGCAATAGTTGPRRLRATSSTPITMTRTAPTPAPDHVTIRVRRFSDASPCCSRADSAFACSVVAPGRVGASPMRRSRASIACVYSPA